MDTLALQLGVLALVDATSAGTLFIPIALLLAPLVRARTVAIYLATVALFYFGLGLILLTVGATLAPLLAGLQQQRAFLIGQLVLGLALFALSYRYSEERVAARRAQRAGDTLTRGSRVDRMKDAVIGADPRAAAVIALGIGAAVIEAASMLPYLAAIGLLSAAPMPGGQRALILACYVLVMCAPAAVLALLRFTAGNAIGGVLRRLSNWFEKNGASVLGWTLGIVGFLLAASALNDLGWVERILD